MLKLFEIEDAFNESDLELIPTRKKKNQPKKEDTPNYEAYIKLQESGRDSKEATIRIHKYYADFIRTKYKLDADSRHLNMELNRRMNALILKPGNTRKLNKNDEIAIGTYTDEILELFDFDEKDRCYLDVQYLKDGVVFTRCTDVG